MGNLTHTVSGGIASFRSAARVPIESLKCHFLPIQEGSGNSSPENIRPIMGWNGITAYKAKKNIGHFVSYSAGTLDSPYGNAYTNGYYGQTLSTTDTSQPLTITSSQWPDEDNKPSYKNGYFCIQCDNLQFGQTYSVSFKITDITNNPLNATLSDIRIANPKGNRYTPIILNNNIVLFNNYTFQQNPNRLQESDIAIYNCGMSCTFSEFIITPAGMNDGVWEPYYGEQIPITFPVVGKNKFDPSCDMLKANAYTVSNDQITQTGSDGRGWTDSNFKPIHLQAGTYTISCSDGNNFNLRTSIDNYESNKQLYNGGGTFTLVEECDVKFKHSASSYPTTFTIQLEFGDTATTYEPYSSNNTVYGGYVDIATGEVWQTIKCHTFNGEEQITDYSSGISGGKRLVSTVFDDCQSDVKYMYCDKAVVETSVQYQISHLGIRIGGGQGRFYFFVPDSMFDGEVTIDKFKQWLSENSLTATALLITPKFVGKLAPMELKTFFNYNNIWSNTNDITEVTYQIHDSNMIKEAKKNMLTENNKHYQKVIWNNIANGYCNSEDYVDRNAADSTSTFDNGIATVNFHPSSDDVVIPSFRTMRINLWPEVYTTHKYYASAEFFAVDNDLALGFEYAGGHQLSWACPANTWVHHSTIQIGRRNGTGTMYVPFNTSNYENMYAKVKNIVYVDLTLMFGEGNEPNAPEEFEGLCAYNGIDLSQPQNQDLIGTTYIWKRPYKTVEWNQWGQLLSSYYYTSQNSSYTSLSFRPYEVTRTMIADSTAVYQTSIVASTSKTHIPTDATHKYYQRQEIYSSNDHRYLAIYGTGDWRYGIRAIPNTWMVLEGISSPSITNNGSSPFLAYDVDNAATGDTCTIRNYMYIDLTQMFGAGKEPSLEEFKRQCTLNGFDLSTFHQYNTGTTVRWII